MNCPPEIDHLVSELANTTSPPLNPRRNGKTARLPKEVRDMLNRMLDDGLPYHIIIDELGEAGRGLNTQNITNWVKGGYQDYLKHQDALDHARAQVEAAIELLKEIGDVDLAQVRRACNYVAATQLLGTLRDHGDETLKSLLQARPAKYLSVVHTLCHQSNSALKLEKHRLAQETSAARKAPSTLPSSQIKPGQAQEQNPAPAEIQTPPPPSSPIKVAQASEGISTEMQRPRLASPSRAEAPSQTNYPRGTNPAPFEPIRANPNTK